MTKQSEINNICSLISSYEDEAFDIKQELAQVEDKIEELYEQYNQLMGGGDASECA